MKRKVAPVVALAFASFGPSGAGAEETVLKFATLDQPEAHHIVAIHRPWAQRINEQGKGVLQIDQRDGPGVAIHPNVYSRVMNDVIQVAWGLQSSVPGKFKFTEVVTMPFLSDRSAIGSVALWRLYKSGVLDAEYDEIVMLKCNVFPQSGMQFRLPPKTIDNLNGVKMIAGGRTAGEIIESQGGAPVTMLPGDYYESLNRATADGVMVGWTAFQPFKLAEVTKYHVEMSLGGASGMVFMPKAKYNALPADAKKILDANATEKDTREFGVFWDRINDETAAQVKAMPGHTVVQPTAAQLAIWQQRMSTISDNWVKRTPGADAILAKYKQLLAEVAKGS
jgi:TRAP-type C4-dicarboxylate transport system substrate-binding protein